MSDILVEAEPRESGSSNVARRLRRERQLPAVVYGGQGESLPITLDPREITTILKSESGRNTLFQLRVGGGSPETVMIFDLQIDPMTRTLQHADLVRIAMDRQIQVDVHIELLGEPLGVRKDGGVLDHSLRMVEVECLPGDIPEVLEIDVSELEIGDSVSVEDLPVPPGVRILAAPERNVASVVPPVSEEELEAAIEALEPELAEVEELEEELEEAEVEEEGEEGEREDEEEKESE